MTGLGEELLAALLVYGYPILGLTLLAGALGLPVPSGLAAAAAGALAADGRMSWWGAIAVSVAALTIGDGAGYYIGLLAGRRFLDRHGRWVGMTPVRVAQAEALFLRWGGLSLLVTRSLLSVIGPAVNILAGTSRYGVWAFLCLNVVGRLAWAGAYIGLGYSLEDNLDAASELLGGLSGLFLSLTVLALAAVALYRRR